MEEEYEYMQEIINMLSEIDKNKEAIRFLYLFVKDVYDEEKSQV